MARSRWKRWAVVGVAMMSGQALASAAETAEQTAIREVLEEGCDGFVKKDLERTMSPYSKDLYTFDISPPRAGNYQTLRETNRLLIASVADGAEPMTCTFKELVISVNGDSAYAHYILPFSLPSKSGRKVDVEGRGTDILKKTQGRWYIVHEHFSVPVHLESGQAELKPPSSTAQSHSPSAKKAP